MNFVFVVYLFYFKRKMEKKQQRQRYTVCLKKTSPTFLAVTLESIVGFS